NRQDEVEPVAHAPFGKRLAEIFIFVGKALSFRDIHETGNTRRRVDDEARRGCTRAADVALQDIVGNDERRLQVAQEALNGVAYETGQYGLVALGDRLDHGAVENVVEAEDEAVDRLDRIGDFMRGRRLRK